MIVPVLTVKMIEVDSTSLCMYADILYCLQ